MATEVEEGTKLSNQTGEALQDIISQVKQTGESIEFVTAAAKEQATVSDQVATSVDSISNITKEKFATWKMRQKYIVMILMRLLN